jgi:hypothetical protein
MSASVSIKVMITKAVVLRTMPTSQNRDMGHPEFSVSRSIGIGNEALVGLVFALD